MIVNKYKILRDNIDNQINIPIEMNWDFMGRDQSVEEYETEMVKEVIGIAKDFETVRFSHDEWNFVLSTPIFTINKKATQIYHNFNFYKDLQPITATTVTPTDWGTSYIYEDFSPQEIYYFKKPFTKSFFKLDLYDTNDEKNQKIYLTIIIPVQQGLTESVSINPLQPNVDIKKPQFVLDYVGDKEGFFIYWLRDRSYINIDEFYMSAKFFDAKLGTFIRMTNKPQSLITPNKFNFDNGQYFYYKVKLNYDEKTYQVFRTDNNTRCGILINQIDWYEYVNP
jgi:hypothetical protein